MGKHFLGSGLSFLSKLLKEENYFGAPQSFWIPSRSFHFYISSSSSPLRSGTFLPVSVCVESITHLSIVEKDWIFGGLLSTKAIMEQQRHQNQKTPQQQQNEVEEIQHGPSPVEQLQVIPSISFSPHPATHLNWFPLGFFKNPFFFI